ncbi:DUF721 domain-containing protein [Limisphaera sp. 4302-co]|uniref:DUF721 domain-containing protein n=1 Tax=Limisphaera sp. 4302-co TaxID=3400417 RepID=UPI003C2A5CC9
MFPPRPQPPLGPPPSSARERALAQWRRTDLTELERSLHVRARTPAELLPKLLADLRLEQRRQDAEIVQAWQALMDPEVTAHAHPTGLKDGTLYVAVDSNAWLAELVTFRRREILQRLQQVFGTEKIRKISFRLA